MLASFTFLQKRNTYASSLLFAPLILPLFAPHQGLRNSADSHMFDTGMICSKRDYQTAEAQSRMVAVWHCSGMRDLRSWRRTFVAVLLLPFEKVLWYGSSRHDETYRPTLGMFRPACHPICPDGQAAFRTAGIPTSWG